MSRFVNRVALITGAASGLGRQIAICLAGEGAKVAGIDLQPEGLRTLTTALPEGSLAWETADVTDRIVLQQAVDKLQARLGPIDLVIASAGIGRETPALEFPAEDFEAMIRVNLIGVGNTIAAVLPSMIQRRSGHLVGISSLASYRGIPRLGGYCASKAGVNALLDALRVELKGHGITVTTVCPGFIRTPMTAEFHDTTLPMLAVEDAAKRIVHAIHRRRPFLAFPPAVARPLGFMRLLPLLWSDWLAANHGRLFDRIRAQRKQL